MGREGGRGQRGRGGRREEGQKKIVRKEGRECTHYVCNSYSMEVSVVREIQYEARGVKRSIPHEAKLSAIL